MVGILDKTLKYLLFNQLTWNIKLFIFQEKAVQKK
mgnify:CR=1 FL=1